MKITFVRHGESEANLLNEFSNRGLKHDLTDKGKAQAAALAQRLTRCSVARIFSSPLLRAIQTAEILSDALQVPYEAVDALREYDCGVLEGRSDARSWAEYHSVLEEWIVHRRWERRIEGGESFVEIKDRFVPFIAHLLDSCGDSPEGMVMVGHGGLYRCVLPLALENIDFGFAARHPLSNTGCVAAESSGGKLVCIEWSGSRGGLERRDGQHLVQSDRGRAAPRRAAAVMSLPTTRPSGPTPMTASEGIIRWTAILSSSTR